MTFSHLKNCDKCSPKGIKVAAWNLVVVYIKPWRKRKWIRKHLGRMKKVALCTLTTVKLKRESEGTNKQTSKTANNAMKQGKGQTNKGRNDRQNERTKACTNEPTNAQMHKRTNAQTHKSTNARMHRHTNARTNARTNEPKNKLANRETLENNNVKTTLTFHQRFAFQAASR